MTPSSLSAGNPLRMIATIAEVCILFGGLRPSMSFIPRVPTSIALAARFGTGREPGGGFECV